MTTSVSTLTKAAAPNPNRALSNRIFAGLIVLAGLLAGISTFLPQGEAVDMTGYVMPASPLVMAIAQGLFVMVAYGALGTLGLFLARKLGLPDLIDPAVTNRQRFLLPAIAGAISGVAIILADLIFAPINGVGNLIHPPFPTSLVASLLAGINEELIFRLFFVSFWTWIVARLILRGRAQNIVYWIVAVISGVAFAAGHLPALMILTGTDSIEALPPLVVIEILLLNGGLSLVAAYYFKKSGYLAAAGVHFWADVIWHVIWGAVV